MSDPYPNNLTVEIDRERLRKYLRVAAFLATMAVCVIFGCMAVIGNIGDDLPKAGLKTVNELIVFCVLGFARGIGVSMLIALLIYFVFFHYTARRYSTSLEVAVEGAYLRVRHHAFISTDRKLHFNGIVDYAVLQGWLMRKCDIHVLRMTTKAGGQFSVLKVYGVKDCLKMRDILSDIDRLRENQ